MSLSEFSVTLWPFCHTEQSLVFFFFFMSTLFCCFVCLEEQKGFHLLLALAGGGGEEWVGDKILTLYGPVTVHSLVAANHLSDINLCCLHMSRPMVSYELLTKDKVSCTHLKLRFDLNYFCHFSQH